MKRIQLIIFAMICTLAAQAQIANGYYRVKSSKQGRYARVLDNRGSINLQTTDADMGALCTQRSWDIVASDPGSVIYIKKMTVGYDLQSQGTGSYAIISYEVRAEDMGDGKYWCYASKAGMVKYLADEQITFLSTEEEIERGSMVTNIGPSQGEYLDWDVIPVSSTGDNYFGLAPTVSARGSYYQTFYAAFPFTFSSTGMEAYYVDGINESTGKVHIKEITGGVPASTPVIVKCSAQNAAGNKLNVGASTSGSASGNKLTGVYFCYPDAGNHTNVKAYDPSTMRVLGTASDGSLAFVKATNLKYIPSNTAYITVSASAPDVLKVSTGEEPIVQTTVSIKAEDKTMVYGDAVPALTYTVTDGTPQGTPELSCEATSRSSVGTYPIKITKGSLTNDVINLTDGTLTINKAPLTITAKSYTIKVGTELPTFEVTYSGFKNNETEGVLTKKPTVTCTATNDSAPGEYDIIVSGAEATNYDISYVAGKLTIKDKETVSIKADDKTMVYGNAVPTLTYTVTEGTPEGEPALSCEATSQSPVGTYTINIANGTLTNDIINLTEGTLTINKAPLTITAKSYEITQGDELPKFEVTYSGFKNSETENVLTKKPTITCAATNDSAPGEYDIIVSDAEATNYNISYVAGKLTIKEPFEVITDDKGSNYIVEDEWNNTVSFAGNTNATNTFEVPSTVTVNGITYTVTMISENAFSGNTSLTEIILPETITSIGSGAFKGCIHLVTITIKTSTPPTLLNGPATSSRRASSVFEGIDKETCILFVPEGSINAYKAAEGWNEFKNIIEYNFSAIHAITVDGKSSNIYDLQGRKVTDSQLSRGVYIMNGRKYVVK